MANEGDFTLEDLEAFTSTITDELLERLRNLRKRRPARLGQGALKRSFQQAINTGLGRGGALDDLNPNNR